MNQTALAMLELGAVILALGILGTVAGRFGVSPIPLYLLGGLAFGHGGVVPLGSADEFSHLAAEIGVVLLLLMLGLEYTAGELTTGLRRNWMAGVVDIVLNATPGAIAALLLGWGPIGALVLGGVTYISSSGIVAKVLTDLKRLGNRETPTVLSILVFEDLAMALYLPILTATLAGVGFFGGAKALGIALVVITVVLFVALRLGHVVSAVLHSEHKEAFLLKIVGAALLVAGLASALQVSAAVGAFMLGIAISGSTARRAAKVLEPLRDLFAAMFFVVFGLNTDPADLPPVLAWALILAIVTLVTKVYTGWWAAARAGIGIPGRVRAGTALVARGEFSIVIAGLAVTAGVAASGEMTAFITAYVLLMAILGPISARLAEPALRLVRRPKAPV